MKKCLLFTVLCALLPSFVFGASYTQLVREKQRKMEELEKCMGSSKGLKIAGLSTIGLTAVGVAGNIAEASKIKEYDSKIAQKDKEIEKVNTQIAKKQAQLAERKAEAEAAIAKKAQREKEADEEARKIKNVVKSDIDAINALTGAIGDKVIVHGYNAKDVPDSLRADFRTSLEGFIAKCRANKGKDGIAEVKMDVENFDIAYKQSGFDEEYILAELDPRQITECEIVKCSKGYKNPENTNRCIKESDDCTDKMQKTDEHVLFALMEDGNCKVQKCDDDFEIKDNKCTEIKEETKEECTGSRVEINGICKSVVGYKNAYGICENDETEKCLSTKPGTFSVYKDGKIETFGTQCVRLSDNKSYCKCELPGSGGKYEFETTLPWADNVCESGCAGACSNTYGIPYLNGYTCSVGEKLLANNCFERINTDYPAPYACEILEGRKWVSGRCECDAPEEWDNASQTCVVLAEKITVAPQKIDAKSVNAPDIKMPSVAQETIYSPSRIACEKTYHGDWDSVEEICKCPEELPDWDGVNNVCKSNNVINSSGSTEILAQPKQEPAALPARDASTFLNPKASQY